MNLYSVHTKILMPFVNETIKALNAMADLQGTAGNGFQENVGDYDFNGYAVCVVARTFGNIEGKVVMNHQIKSALSIGNRLLAKMMGETYNIIEITAEIGDALTEFSNTVIGLATRSFSDTESQLQFSAPLPIDRPADIEYIMEGVQEILSIPIDIAGVGSISFSYLLHQKTH